jgi:hypothetical protein
MKLEAKEYSEKKKIKKKAKKQMTEDEKENLYNLLSLLCKEYENDKDYSLMSIDHLFENKYNNGEFVIVEQFNEEFNQKILNVNEAKGLMNILNIYKDSCTRKVNLNLNTLLNLLKLFLKFEEFDYSLFFLCEMDKLNFQIPKSLMKIIRELPKVKRINKSTSFCCPKSNDKIRKNIINPVTSFYMRSPNYFFYKSKKESYINFDQKKIMTILELAQIDDNIATDNIREIATKNANNQYSQYSPTSASTGTSFLNTTRIPMNLINYQMNCDKLNNNRQILAREDSESVYNTKSKLEEITRGQIREYVPKNFRISLKK